jgi:hypothetical protein
MPEARWFWQQVDECTRLARNTSEPGSRDHYETQAEQWRDIAKLIEAGERLCFKSGSKRPRPGKIPNTAPRITIRYLSTSIGNRAEAVSVGETVGMD